MLKQINIENAHLLPGLFKERADLNRSYLMELKTENLLQNFYLEACIRTDRDISEMHLGWESPTCQLRGHFLGHWLSAASMLIAQNNDCELKAKLDIIIDELERCQKLNGGKWIGSVPEKYFQCLEKNEYIWSPQYTLHKTLLGLYHSAMYAKNEKALDILNNAADWYLDWTADMQNKNPHAVYSGEEGGMLEVWAGLYQLTGNEKYLTLAERYSHPSIFKKLADGGDPLSNCHANASIPWAQGAAKMYEITDDEKWLGLVKSFWKCAVTDREAFCTGGQNSGEFWIPPHKLGMFIGDRTQEFCTVYNMVRLADYLFRFTGDTAYLDYIEKNLYNGFLAQQNKFTGMPAYFLPMKSGSMKKWGSKTKDFWCCHGTTVQAHTIYPQLCFYEYSEKNRLVIGQYINSEYKRSENVTVSQSVDMKYYNDGASFDEHDDSRMSRWYIKLNVRADKPESFTLSLRIPEWTQGAPIIFINGEEIKNVTSKNGYFDIDRTWKNDTINIYFPAALTISSLPDMPKLTAFAEGPVVLAGLCEKDCGICMKDGEPESALAYTTEHTYSTFPWQQSVYRTVGQPENFDLVPLYDITDEPYTVYFTKKNLS
ncbi:MAG: beta-L-arabinofuranosidase domain-containing protein [Huintestinicola sp.]|uniref:beta-L-arabinofuranosidase domain-containing protein n=1 Tax=Huintestinicola sp. TaxID=2981661 RepID=UPI003F0D662B